MLDKRRLSYSAVALIACNHSIASSAPPDDALQACNNSRLDDLARAALHCGPRVGDTVVGEDGCRRLQIPAIPRRTVKPSQLRWSKRACDRFDRAVLENPDSKV